MLCRNCHEKQVNRETRGSPTGRSIEHGEDTEAGRVQGHAPRNYRDEIR
jgi:hypothetical protein